MCVARVAAHAAAAQDEIEPRGAARRLIREEAHMDGRQFDALVMTHAEAQSRRQFSRMLAGGALGALAATVARDAGAAKSKTRGGASSDRHAASASKNARPPADSGADAAESGAKRKRRCRSSQTICSKNGQCCPSTSGYVCAWNGNNEGATVCCGVNGARCLGDYDCCNQAVCIFGVCVG
jgi:hypothetical protein